MELTNHYVSGLLRPLPTLASALVVCIATCGCVYALRPYNQPVELALRVQSADPQKYVIQVEDEKPTMVPGNGRVTLYVPRLARGCATYLFGVVKVKDYSACDVPIVCFKKDGRTVRKFSLNDVAKLPLDEESYRLVSVE